MVRSQGLGFYGPRDELDSVAALKTIQAKITSQGCELVTIIEWGKGGPILGDASTWWQSGGKGCRGYWRSVGVVRRCSTRHVRR